MYQPYDRYPHQEYQEYEPAHYPPSNPFQAHPPQGQSNDQRRNKTKRRPPPRRPAPVVPQPTGTPAPVSATPQVPGNIPPGHKWAIVPENTPELEPARPSADLKAAQNAANRMQETVEAAISCLLEHRLEYSLENFGILEPFGMQKKIEVIVGSATIGSIIIAGIDYLRKYGLPCTSPDRLLGKCTFISFNQEGALHGFTDLSKLTALAQDDRLAKYDQVHGKTIKGFLNHFAGSGTFYRRPDTVVLHGIRCTTLQDALTNANISIEGFQGTCWSVVDVYKKLDEQLYLDIGEVAMAEFEKLKGPVETRTALLKSCNVHSKDFLGALSYLPNAQIPLRRLRETDLMKMVEAAPASEDSLDPDVLERLENMETTLNQILDRLRNMYVVEELETAREELKQLAARKHKSSKEEPEPKE